jgi:hypothetical protein
MGKRMRYSCVADCFDHSSSRGQHGRRACQSKGEERVPGGATGPSGLGWSVLLGRAGWRAL